MNVQPEPSRSAVKKAGSRIRAFGRGELDDLEVLNQALDVVVAYRAQFGKPLNSLAMGLRSMARTLGIEAEVSQRLKRTPTIIEKLQRRDDAPDLSRMADIGGCRAVVPRRDDLWRLVERARKLWGDAVEKEIDYIANPRPSGYRAVHMHVRRNDRLIEVQFRDALLHAWAEDVEAFSMLSRVNYKQDGGSDVQEYMAMISQVDQMRESGHYDADLLARADTLRERVIENLALLAQDDGEDDR